MFPAGYKAEYTKEFEAKAIAPKRFPHYALQVERRLNSIINFDTIIFMHMVTSPCLVIILLKKLKTRPDIVLISADTCCQKHEVKKSNVPVSFSLNIFKDEGAHFFLL